jgi:hypothetical protein
MYRKGEFELALLKGMEVKLHPLMAGAYPELEPTMVRWRISELVVRKGVSREYPDPEGGELVKRTSSQETG